MLVNAFLERFTHIQGRSQSRFAPEIHPCLPLANTIQTSNTDNII